MTENILKAIFGTEDTVVRHRWVLKNSNDALCQRLYKVNRKQGKTFLYHPSSTDGTKGFFEFKDAVISFNDIDDIEYMTSGNLRFHSSVGGNISLYISLNEQRV